jgi:hypothetical protein
MQTFLPYPSFTESARVLDRQRLGKQRVECVQILNALTGRSKGWINHPATKMWKGHEGALATYGFVICREWKDRGYKDTCMDKICDMKVKTNFGSPLWYKNEAFHSSHRAALLFKNPEWYGQFGWTEKPELNYIWPVDTDVK